MNKNLEKNFKKTRWIVISLLSIVTLLLIATVVYLSRSNKTQKTVSKPTIALVNEDSSSTFNKKDYHFGKDFVSLVSGDTKYNWQVVSRSVADRAYADKSVDAVIYIPQAFSHDILTLQDINPIKSQVNYKLQASQSALSQNILNDKITSILKDFNQNIVKMYYASVAGNISEAQNNMNDVITNQDNVLSTLSHQVYGPFQSTNQNYSSVIASANGLKSENSAWIASQNSFTKSTQSMLDSTSKTFNGQLTGLQKYFDIQKQIADVNLKNGNKGITNQSEDDQKVYYKQFDDSHTNTFNNLFNFYKKDDSTESGVLTHLQNQVKDYNTKITTVRDDLTKQIDDATKNRDQLLELENQLYQQFFAQDSTTVDLSNFDKNTDMDVEGSIQNDPNAQEALYRKISQSFLGKDNLSKEGYLDNLKTLLGKYSWNEADYQNLFDAMVGSGVDTTLYKKELQLISSYGNAAGAIPGTVDFSGIPTDNNINQTLKKTMQITVPAGKNYTLQVADGSSQVTLDNANADAAYPEASTTITENSVELHNMDHDEGDHKAENKKLAVFTINYTVTLNNSNSPLITFKWGDASDKNSSSSQYTLYPENQIKEVLGGDQLNAITQVLNNIEKSATLITWLYGTTSDTVDSFEGHFLSGPYTLDDFKNYNSSSIANLYGNMDRDKIKAGIEQKDILDYKTKGHENINKVIQSITSVNESITALSDDKKTLSDSLPDNVFSQNIKELQDWYATTMTSINEQFDSWMKNENQTLELKNWEQYNADDTALYQDTAASDALYKTISELSTSTAKSADETSKSAQLIKDNGNEFTQMVATTQETKTSAEKLLKNTDNLLNTGNTSLKDSKNYNSNFGKVLANTRSQNSNKNQLFDFFAQPLSIKNLTSAITSVKKGIDWRWPLVLIIGVLLGLLGSMFSKMISDKKR
ncbi:type VII secretion protein EsaA [Lactococcus lactis subsp. lactis]|uniref:Type VII secretion protein EsaA n=1 Tax=Lactococcus lactis subsp. lactis TaxID=1360 RepID=A0A2Z3KGD7_LACLL|nr:type VII secretion protein EsaA [Lactococcus lactis]AWN66547.1 type VII secretion protein EsaA [Lactococcus lactis subsp. lactis]